LLSTAQIDPVGQDDDSAAKQHQSIGLLVKQHHADDDNQRKPGKINRHEEARWCQ